MKEKEKISWNVDMNWGGLVYPVLHDAAIGVRIADNRRRDFGIFQDRMTICGDKKVANKLHKWLFSNKTLKMIKKNTSFSRSVDDRNCWATREDIGNLRIILDVECRGEYAYVKAYADLSTGIGGLSIFPARGKDDGPCWQIEIKGGDMNFPVIHASSKEFAESMLLDYIANELSGKDDLWP